MMSLKPARRTEELEVSETAPPSRGLISTMLFYVIVFAGFGLLVAAAFVVFTKPIWLLLIVPLLGVWSVWLLNEYWNWIRRLGK
jgi:hypothetical protein